MKAGQWRRLIGKNQIHLTYVGQNLYVLWTARKMSKWVFKQIKPNTNMTNLNLSYLGHNKRRQCSLEKITMLGKTEASKKRGKANMKWTDSITELDMSQEELSRAGEERTLWALSFKGPPRVGANSIACNIHTGRGGYLSGCRNGSKGVLGDQCWALVYIETSRSANDPKALPGGETLSLNRVKIQEGVYTVVVADNGGDTLYCKQG